LRALDRWLFAPLRRAAQRAGVIQDAARVQSGVFALLIAFVIIITTEPFLLRAAPPSEYRVKLVIPVLGNAATPAPAPSTSNPSTMDKSTIISIGIFALFQVVIYLICLMKISEIDRRTFRPRSSCGSWRNEENLLTADCMSA